MNDILIERISSSAKALSPDLYAKDLAGYIDDYGLTHEELKAVCDVFEYLEKKKHESMVYTMLKLSIPKYDNVFQKGEDCHFDVYEKLNDLLNSRRNKSCGYVQNAAGVLNG